MTFARNETVLFLDDSALWRITHVPGETYANGRTLAKDEYRLDRPSNSPEWIVVSGREIRSLDDAVSEHVAEQEKKW